METLKCVKGCCTLFIKPYIPSKNRFDKISRQRKKSGVFLYDPKTNKTLLVQSRGSLWGPPKGTVDYGETERMCAIRELKEETGLTIAMTDFTKAMKIQNRALYFYSERDQCDVKVQDHIEGNDANGLGWIELDCLEQFIKDGHIHLSQHCRQVFQYFLGRTFPVSTFTVVKRK